MYQAIWADNIDFAEVLISPTMVQDHMPDKVMEALEKVSQLQDLNINTEVTHNISEVTIDPQVTGHNAEVTIDPQVIVHNTEVTIDPEVTSEVTMDNDLEITNPDPRVTSEVKVTEKVDWKVTEDGDPEVITEVTPMVTCDATVGEGRHT